MNRFTKCTPQVETYLNKKMNELESGQMKNPADKLQLFQDLYDTGLHTKLGPAASQYLEVLIENEMIQTIRPSELN